MGLFDFLNFNAITVSIKGQMFAILGFVVIYMIIDFIYRKTKNNDLSMKPIKNYHLLESIGKTKEQKKIIKFFRPGIFNSIVPISKELFDSTLENKKNEYGANIEQRALEAHGTDADEVKEISPIHMENFRPDSKYFKTLRDNTIRASDYQMSCLMFSDKQLYAYSLLFDMTSEKTVEQTKEYFYEDITNIDIIHEKPELLNPRHWAYPLFSQLSIFLGWMMIAGNLHGLIMYLGFIFFITGLIVLFFTGFTRSVVADNLNLRLTVPGDVFECAMSRDNIPAVQGMKAKIREKKR